MRKLCFAFLIVCFVLCMGADFFAPYSYAEQNLQLGASSPTLRHIFGTDNLGRDLFSRMLYGGRVSFAIGIFATLFASVIGVSYGVVSAYFGKKCDYIMMRIVDIAYSLPFAVIVILLTLAFGRSVWLLFVALGIAEWMTMARIVRGQVLELKSRQFVEASAVLGQSTFKVIVKHILPNALPAVLVCATLTVPSVMLLESFLSFLGLGVQAPLPSWGTLLSEGADLMETAPHLLIFPSIAFSLTLFSINRLGEFLKEKLAR